MEQYRAANGDPERLSERWRTTRNNFVARHEAQAKLWDASGDPTRQHLALAVWAYSPEPGKLSRWLSKHERNKGEQVILSLPEHLQEDFARPRTLPRYTPKRDRGPGAFHEDPVPEEELLADALLRANTAVPRRAFVRQESSPLTAKQVRKVVRELAQQFWRMPDKVRESREEFEGFPNANASFRVLAEYHVSPFTNVVLEFTWTDKPRHSRTYLVSRKLQHEEALAIRQLPEDREHPLRPGERFFRPVRAHESERFFSQVLPRLEAL